MKNNRSLGVARDAWVKRISALITVLVIDNWIIPVFSCIIDLHYLLLTWEFLFGWGFTFLLFLSPVFILNRREDNSHILLPYQTQKQKMRKIYNKLQECSVTPKKYLFLYLLKFKTGGKKTSQRSKPETLIQEPDSSMNRIIGVVFDRCGCLPIAGI